MPGRHVTDLWRAGHGYVGHGFVRGTVACALEIWGIWSSVGGLVGDSVPGASPAAFVLPTLRLCAPDELQHIIRSAWGGLRRGGRCLLWLAQRLIDLVGQLSGLCRLPQILQLVCGRLLLLRINDER